jgi:SAM-dependent methyltransferase
MADPSPGCGTLRRPDHVSILHEPLLQDGAGERWDLVAYAPETYDSFIWELERRTLVAVVRRLAAGRPALKYLDFACGTGRVLSAVEELVGTAHGLDISPAMVRVAARKSPRAGIRVGDLLTEPDTADRDYDLITAFRFFLNAEPPLRLPYLRQLGSRLHDADSRLIFNVHSNAASLDGLAGRFSKDERMWVRDIRKFIADAGLELVEWYGFGLMPACRQRLRHLRPLMRMLDRLATLAPWLRHLSRDLIFVCAPGER